MAPPQGVPCLNRRKTRKSTDFLASTLEIRYAALPFSALLGLFE